MLTPDSLLLDVPLFFDGPRIRVAAYQAGQGQALFDAVNEDVEHLLPYMVWARGHTSVEESEKVVRRAAARFSLREDFTMGMWDRERNRFLGGTGLHRMDWSIPSFEIGYWIRRSETGNGYVTEATQILTRAAFRALRAERVFIRVSTQNEPSLRIPRRLGFVEEGVLRRSVRDANGVLHDLVMFSMVREDFAAAPWAMEE